MPLTEQVVTSLLDGYESKGHVVYMDNFYSSPSLIFRKVMRQRDHFKRIFNKSRSPDDWKNYCRT